MELQLTSRLCFENTPSHPRREVRQGDIIVLTVRPCLRAIAPIKNPPLNLTEQQAIAAYLGALVGKVAAAERLQKCRPAVTGKIDVRRQPQFTTITK